MSKKFQIFISSTYDDLREVREEVIRAILEMGHIPVGMEMFSAADDDQWRVITRTISQSDYYVVIVAHRYGSLAGGISYTEKEYDFAVASGIPVIGFVIQDDAPWPASKIETESKKRKKLAAFREKVKRKPIGFWATARDLYGKTSIALTKLFETNPRPGWIRGASSTSTVEDSQPPNKVDRFIDITFEHQITSHQVDSDRSYYRTICTNVLGDEEFGTQNKIHYQIGEIESTLINIGEAINDRVSRYDVFDETQELSDLAREIYDFQKDEISSAVRKAVGDDLFVDRIIVVDRIVVFERFRGYRVSYGALLDLLWNLGGLNCLYVIYIYPPQFLELSNDEKAKMELSQFTKSEVAARARLVKYFSDFGFKSIGPKSNIMVLSSANAQPDIFKLGFSGYIKL